MLTSYILSVPLFVCTLTAAHSPVALNPAVKIRTAPGQSIQDTYIAVKRELGIASLQKRKQNSTNISLAKTWQNFPIFVAGAQRNISQTNSNNSIRVSAGINVTCKYCYMRGNVIAELTIDDNFNASKAVNDTKTKVTGELGELREAVGTYLETYVDNVWKNITSDGLDKSDFDLPTFPYSFDLDTISAIPEATVRFQFDGLELYMDMSTIINVGATYEISLYVFNSEAGVKIGALQLGFVVTVDLILSAEGEIDISNGFHIQLNDGVELKIPLFGKEVSDMKFNGGQFELLPVVVESAGIRVSAALRVGVSLGLSVGPPKPIFPLDLAAGMEVAVFANVAEFGTAVNYDVKNTTCALQVVQDYRFAVGAQAGASIKVQLPSVLTRTVSRAANVSTAIFTTTLAELCIPSRAPRSIAASTTPAIKPRADFTTTTLSTTIVNSAVSCKISGVANCPVSAQVTTRNTVTSTIVTSVPSGWKSSFPAETINTVASTVPFGESVNKIAAMTGKPTEYTATATHTLSGLEEKVGGLSKKAIIGIAVGVGVPVILIILGCCLFCLRRRKRAAKTQAQ